MTNPPKITDGLGELIRAMRIYTGLSQRELVSKLRIDRRTYQRIENGQEPCPVGFLDTMEGLIDDFEKQVDVAIEEAEKMVICSLNPDDIPESDRKRVHFPVTDSDADSWTRAVIGRAAVESGGVVVPVMRGRQIQNTC